MLVFLLIIIISSINTHSFPPALPAAAEQSHIVSLYVDGQTKVFTTSATTVGVALAQAGVQLGSNDLVEPAVSTALTPGYFNINVYRARPVTIIDGDQTYHISSAYQAPALLAQAAGITVYPQDGYAIQTITNFVGDGSVGEQVTILRSIPFTVVIDGQAQQLRSRATTVGAALTDQHVALGLKDIVSVPLTAPLTAGMTINITRVNDVTTTVAQQLPFTTQTTYDSTLPAGQQQVQQPGVNGHEVVTYHITYNNGQVVSQTTLAVRDLVNPQTEIVVVGTKVDSSSQAVQLGQQLAAARGWTNDEWVSLYQLWEHESGWSPNDVNGSSGACGIPQADPCSKMGLQLDAQGQIEWGLNYIASRYGDPDTAWAYWQAHDSY